MRDAFLQTDSHNRKSQKTQENRKKTEHSDTTTGMPCLCGAVYPRGDGYLVVILPEEGTMYILRWIFRVEAVLPDILISSP